MPLSHLIFAVWLLAYAPAWASTCAEDIAAVDKALRSQYGEDRSGGK